MQYDKSALTRRALLSGVACLCALGAYRRLTDTPLDAPAPGSPAGPPSAGGPPDAAAAAPPARADPGTYRMRPLAGHARMPEAKPGTRRPALLRTQAHLTLASPGRRLALTFDDGPHPAHTLAILRILRRHGTRATFFVIGENAVWNQDLLKAIEADGHLIANHTWSHPELPGLSRARVREELGRTSDLIEQVLGSPPRFARAPYGAWHPPSLQVCAELGMEPMGWSVDTLDWKSPGAAAIGSRVLDGAHPGAIVLAHDGGGDRSQTVTALARFLPRLLARGYSLVPLAAPA